MDAFTKKAHPRVGFSQQPLRPDEAAAALCEKAAARYLQQAEQAAECEVVLGRTPQAAVAAPADKQVRVVYPESS